MLVTPKRPRPLFNRVLREPAPDVAALAVAAFVLRSLGLARSDGMAGVDYHEGVYFSAAASLAQGVWPYEDFVFLHPPGIVALLAPMAFVGDHLGGYHDAFTAGRFLLAGVDSSAAGRPAMA